MLSLSAGVGWDGGSRREGGMKEGRDGEEKRGREVGREGGCLGREEVSEGGINWKGGS